MRFLINPARGRTVQYQMLRSVSIDIISKLARRSMSNYHLLSPHSLLTPYLGRGVKIITSDSVIGVTALFKPAGILSHPNSSDEKEFGSGVALLKGRYYDKKEMFELGAKGTTTAKGDDGKGNGEEIEENTKTCFWLLHRLDSCTSGVILLAHSKEVADEVKSLFASRKVTKIYNAIVFGALKSVDETWIDRVHILKKSSTKRLKAFNPKESKHVEERTVETYALALKTNKGKDVSMVQLYPKTGVTHQLRFQCAAHGVAIVGDRNYGDFKRNKEAKLKHGAKSRLLYLHASEIRFSVTRDGKEKIFLAKSDLPSQYTSFFEST